MTPLPTGIVVAFGIVLVAAVCVHRVIPLELLIHGKLRRMPITPEIAERITGAGRLRILFAVVGAMVGLGMGFALTVAAKSAIANPGWRPGVSAIYCTAVGWIAGMVVYHARYGYAFAAPGGPRVANSRRPTVRSMISLPGTLISHLCVAIIAGTAVWLAISPSARPIRDAQDSMLGDVWLMGLLAVLMLVAADVIGIWLTKVPTSASTPLELAWDTAMKAVTVQRILSFPMTVSGVASIITASTFVVDLPAPQRALLVGCFALMFVGQLLPDRLPAFDAGRSPDPDSGQSTSPPNPAADIAAQTSVRH